MKNTSDSATIKILCQSHILTLWITTTTCCPSVIVISFIDEDNDHQPDNANINKVLMNGSISVS